MFHYAYVLLSKKDGDTYTGSTDNLRQRLGEHHRGYVPATKDRRPLELVYFEGHRSRKAARARERYLKTGWGRNYLKKILSDA